MEKITIFPPQFNPGDKVTYRPDDWKEPCTVTHSYYDFHRKVWVYALNLKMFRIACGSDLKARV